MRNKSKTNSGSGIFTGVVLASLFAVLTPASSQGRSPEGNVPLFTFDGSVSADGWRIINDGVMGGVSKSSVITNPSGALIFSGTLSLDNNGGFASTRSAAITKKIGSYDGIELVVTGDGNKYKCGIRTNNRFDGIAHQASFKTSSGKEQRIRIPFSDFDPTWHGRRLSEDKRMNPDDVRNIGFLIADKQEGSFQLEVKSISAYRENDPDTVSGELDIISIANEAGVFKTLLAAVDAAGLTDTVRSLKGVTLFAPTDEAFEKLSDDTVASLLKPENKDQLLNILTYHVIDAEVPFSTATTLDSATALNGEKVSITVKKGALFFNDSRVVENDIETGNGLIHVIDSVLLPPASEPAETSPVEAIISSAIQRGVPLFNSGHSQACTDIYELAAEALLTLPQNSVSSNQRETLTLALDKSKEQNSNAARAWTMRIALDKVIDSSTH